MTGRLQKCIDMLKAVRVRTEDIPTEGNDIIIVINTLIDLKEEMEKRAEGVENDVCS